MLEIHVKDLLEHFYKVNNDPKFNSSNLEREQQRNEQTIIYKEPLCLSSTIKYIYANKYNLDNEKYSDYMVDEFYNKDVMDASQCISTTFFTDSKLSTKYKLNDWIKSLVIVGEGSHGIAMKSNIYGNKDIFAIKVSNEDIIHEYFIGVYGVNKLRKYVPNFMYTFGMFHCGKIIQELQDENKVLSLCNDMDTSYIILEYIPNSISFANAILTKRLNKDVWINIYIQLMYSLIIANEKIDFTHYDLHPDNVLIRYLDENVSIPYTTERETIYVNTNFVATIIDYGYSHIQYKGKHYGIHGYSDIGRYSDRSHPFHDLFNILTMSAYILRENNALDSQYQIMNQIYKIFDGANDLESTLNGNHQYTQIVRRTIYEYPFDEKFRDKNIYLDFIDKVKKIIGETDLLTYKPKYKVINCNEISCTSTKDYYSNVISKPITNQNFLSFYDAYMQANSRIVRRRLERKVSKDLFDKTEQRINSLLGKINSKIKFLHKHSIITYNIKELYKYVDEFALCNKMVSEFKVLYFSMERLKDDLPINMIFDKDVNRLDVLMKYFIERIYYDMANLNIKLKMHLGNIQSVLYQLLNTLPSIYMSLMFKLATKPILSKNIGERWRYAYSEEATELLYNNIIKQRDEYLALLDGCNSNTLSEQYVMQDASKEDINKICNNLIDYNKMYRFIEEVNKSKLSIYVLVLIFNNEYHGHCYAFVINGNLYITKFIPIVSEYYRTLLKMRDGNMRNMFVEQPMKYVLRVVKSFQKSNKPNKIFLTNEYKIPSVNKSYKIVDNIDSITDYIYERYTHF